METAASDDPGNAADLVSRIRAGDQRAESELVERFGRGVQMILRRSTRNAAVSDDLYQDTFRIALEKVRQGDLRDPARLGAFICSVARNLVIEYFRRTARHENLTEMAEAERSPHCAPNQLEAVLQKERAAIVRQAINERLRWRTEYAEAKACAGPHNRRSATHQPAAFVRLEPRKEDTGDEQASDQHDRLARVAP